MQHDHFSHVSSNAFAFDFITCLNLNTSLARTVLLMRLLLLAFICYLIFRRVDFEYTQGVMNRPTLVYLDCFKVNLLP